MRDSKVYISIAYLTAAERSKLEKFLRSPYFNSNENALELYQLLETDIRKPKGESLLKESLWEEIFPSASFDDLRFRRLCSDLLRLIEKFLSQELFEENTLHQASYLMEAVSRKKMDKLYNSTVKTARRLSQYQFYKSSSYYYYQYQIEKKLFAINQLDLERREKTNYEAIVSNLDQFYIAEKMRYYCDYLSRTVLTSHSYEILFMDEILNHLTEFPYEENPAISIYYQMYQTQINTQDENQYYRLKELLNKYGQLFPQAEADEIYGSALNYCIRKVNNGDTRFSREYFDLYLDLIEKDLFLIEEVLSPWKFRNIIIAALRLGEFDWVEAFIDRYKKHIPHNYRDNAVNYNSAMLHFYKKEFDLTLRYLQEVDYNEETYDLGSKSMLLASYYELGEVESLYSICESFRIYLNRNKNILNSKRRVNYQNLIKFVRKLSLIESNDKVGIEKLLVELDAAKGVASETWLREKIAEKMQKARD